MRGYHTLFTWAVLACSVIIPAQAQQRVIVNSGFDIVPQEFTGFRFIDADFGFQNSGLYSDRGPFLGWASTHSSRATQFCNLGPVIGNCHPIELWDRTFSPLNGAGSINGDYLAELDADEPTMLYQAVCLQNGETIDFEFYHKRRATTGTETVIFSVEDNTETTIQSLTVSIAASDAWNQRNGAVNYTGPDGVARLGFRSGGAGTIGNLMDAISIKLEPFIDFEGGIVSGPEDNTDLAFYMRVNGTAENTTISLRHSTGTATPGVDYTLGPPVGPVSSTGTYRVDARIGEITFDGTDTWTITLPDGDYDGGIYPEFSQGFIKVPVIPVDDGFGEISETAILDLLAPGEAGASTNWKLLSPTCSGAANTSSTITLEDSDGISISGSVIEDNGENGGTAHDGIYSPNEAGIEGVQIRAIRKSDGSIISATTSKADGSYFLSLPDVEGNQEILIETNAISTFRAVSENPGTLPGLISGSDTDGQIEFTPSTDSHYGNVNFGQIQLPVLVEPRLVSVASGQSVILAHQYKSFTSGEVVFSTQNAHANPSEGFSTSIFLDTNCNSILDATELGIENSISVFAGDIVCILIRTVVASSVPEGGELSYSLHADTQLAGITVQEITTNEDIITVSSAGFLTLSKQVCNITRNSCDDITGSGYTQENAGFPGDRLRYRLVFETPSDENVENIEVYDNTPDFTSLVGGSVTIVQSPQNVNCSVSQPPGGGSEGYEGIVEWVCSGVMTPGQFGILGFDVRLDP